jgi:hypothetical protein
MKLERDSVQLAFSFYFFDDECWNCANPFHHRPACYREDNRALHLFAKQMHEINHPLTLWSSISSIVQTISFELLLINEFGLKWFDIIIYSLRVYLVK